MAEEFKGKMNVAVLVAGPAEEEHDALLHKALLIEKELAKVANVSILGKKLEFYCCSVMNRPGRCRGLGLERVPFAWPYAAKIFWGQRQKYSLKLMKILFHKAILIDTEPGNKVANVSR